MDEVRLKCKLFRISLLCAILLLVIVLVPDLVVKLSSKNKTYSSIRAIPPNRVGLLLGTTKFSKNRKINLYYKYRLDAAVQLYYSGKIDFLLVSGDNRKSNYDEPTTIKNDLIAEGISESKIYLDYAGFRTLDSVIRCKEIFGQESITIISQRFHNERAIYIAGKKNIKAIGFNAKDVNVYYGFRTRVRELFARDKMVIDLIFDKKPRFLGEKIEIKNI